MVGRWVKYLFGFRRPVERLPYLLLGAGLMALKFGGDTFILRRFGHAGWTPLEFLSPFYSLRFREVTAQDAVLTLGLWSLPFVWIGASLTYRRCLDAGLPGGMALSFFVPGLNYLLFFALSVAPTQRSIDPTNERGPVAENGLLLDRVAKSQRLMICVASGALVGLLTFAGAMALGQNYGAALFVGSPFAIGFVAAKLQGVGPDRLGPTLTGQLSLILAGGVLLLAGIEGLICLAMAYPLAAILAFVGSQIASLGPLPADWGRGKESAFLLFMVVLLPFLAAMERPDAPLREVVTTIEIDAPPEVVWQHVIEFSDLPPPSDWIFRTGIAYPIRAHIEGRGLGAVRHCEFSTGAFVEPITRWDDPERLSFDVVARPPTMQEWSPYQHVEPAHLTETLRSERGEFRLVRLPDGGTRLEGSTWYRLEMAPQVYWTLWSDAVIHQIHRRVLRHIRAESHAALDRRVRSGTTPEPRLHPPSLNPTATGRAGPDATSP